MAHCNVCSDIIAPILQRRRKLDKGGEVELGTWAEFTQRTECPTCSSIVQQLMIKQIRLYSAIFEPTCRLTIKAYTLSTFWIRSNDDCRHLHPLIGLLPGKAPCSGSQYYVEVGHFPIVEQQIRTWASYCDSNHHGKCHGLPPLRSLRRPSSLILIDVTSLCLTENDGTAQYLALSYVWGQIPDTLELTRATAHNLFRAGALGPSAIHSKLPKTIRDAIQLTKRLDIRYLWVDRLCIIQDDPDQVAAQIQQMASIYASAYFTILALDGKDANHGLEGLSRDGDYQRYTQTVLHFPGQLRALVSIPHENMETAWHTRGWTFQERVLSRRCLGFTGGTLFWRCKKAKWWEEIAAEPEGVPEEKWSIARANHNHSYSLAVDSWPNNNCYWNLVSLYTTRKLTFNTDAPRAFTAVIDSMSRTFPGGFHWGIPAFFFDMGLLWRNRLPHQRRNKLPSWSWMGWSQDIEGTGVRPHHSQESYNPDNVMEFPANGSIKTTVEWYICETLGGERSQINNSWQLCVTMRKPPRIALSHGWSCREPEHYDSLSDSSTSSQDGSIKADEEGIQDYDNLDSGESDSFHDMGESSLKENSKHNGNDDDDDDRDSTAFKGSTRTVFHHQSMGDERSFAYPVPVTETPLELSPHTWSRFICFSTVRQHYILDGSSYDPHPRYTGHCLCINLHSPSGTWAGLLESNLNRADDVMGLRGSKCELVVVSAEVVKRRKNYNGLTELECRDALKSVRVYEFYNVLWIEWQDGIAYRKGIGRVWKEAWDGQDSEKVDVVLG